MAETTLQGKTIEYDVRRSSRAKYARIDIDLRGIKVVIPNGKNLDAEHFLHEKEDWVLDKYQEIEDYRARIPDRQLEAGDSLPFLGEEHIIRVSEKYRADIVDGEIHIPAKKLECFSLKEAIERLYRKQARKKIKQLIDKYADRIDTDFNKLYIRNQKTKWGSCSSKNNLSFNWRLMMAPEKVVEYVVVHELLHLEEPHHSNQFWRKMEQMLPDYRDRRKWLKENSPTLIFSEEDY